MIISLFFSLLAVW